MRPRGRNSFCGAYSAGHPFEVVGVEFPLQLPEFLGFLVTSVIEDGLLELLELIEKFLRPDVHLLKLLQLLLRVMLLFQPSIDDLVAIAQLAPRARMNHHLLGRLVHRPQLAEGNACFFPRFIAGRAQHIVEHVRNQVVLSLEELDDVISRLNKSFDHGDNLPVNWIGSGADGLRATPKDFPAVAVIQPFGSSAATRSPSGARRWASIAELQTQLDAFVDAYNHRRPHRSLPHQATPATVYYRPTQSRPSKPHRHPQPRAHRPHRPSRGHHRARRRAPAPHRRRANLHRHPRADSDPGPPHQNHQRRHRRTAARVNPRPHQELPTHQRPQRPQTEKVPNLTQVRNYSDVVRHHTVPPAVCD